VNGREENGKRGRGEPGTEKHPHAKIAKNAKKREVVMRKAGSVLQLIATLL